MLSCMTKLMDFFFFFFLYPLCRMKTKKIGETMEIIWFTSKQEPRGLQNVAFCFANGMLVVIFTCVLLAVEF